MIITLPTVDRPSRCVLHVQRSAMLCAMRPSVIAYATAIADQWWSENAPSTDTCRDFANALLRRLQSTRSRVPIESTALARYIDGDVIAVAQQGGDCGARSHAYVSLLLAVGIDARIVWAVTPVDGPDHMIALVRCGDAWLYADPSGSLPLQSDPPGHVSPIAIA